MTFCNPNEYGVRFIKENDLMHVLDVIRSRDMFRYSSGASNCTIVENLISSRIQGRSALLVSSGTAGIRATLKALGVGYSDFVAVNAFTFIATASAVYSVGAQPVPVDFDPETNISLRHLTEVLGHKPAAVIAVHWPGRCFDLTQVKRLCDEHKVVLIEDACQSFAARTGKVSAGHQGAAAVFSFQQNKLISCGEGGCIVAEDTDLMCKIRQYIDHGISRTESGFPEPDWVIQTPGENLRLTEIQASLLRGQLEKLDALLQNLAEGKSQLLVELSAHGIKEWAPMCSLDLGQVATFLFADEVAANQAEKYDRDNAVLLKPIWPKTFYQCYAPEIYKSPMFQRCLTAEAVASRVRILPTPPNMKNEDISKICAVMTSLRPYLIEKIS